MIHFHVCVFCCEVRLTGAQKDRSTSCLCHKTDCKVHILQTTTQNTMRTSKLEEHLVKSFELSFENARSVISEARAELKMKPWQRATPELWRLCEVVTQKKAARFSEEKRMLSDAISNQLRMKTFGKKPSPHLNSHHRGVRDSADPSQGGRTVFSPPTQLANLTPKKKIHPNGIPVYINVPSNEKIYVCEKKSPPTSPSSQTSNSSRKSIEMLNDVLAMTMTVPRVVKGRKMN